MNPAIYAVIAGVACLLLLLAWDNRKLLIPSAPTPTTRGKLASPVEAWIVLHDAFHAAGHARGCELCGQLWAEIPQIAEGGHE